MSNVYIKVSFDDGTTFEATEYLIGDANPFFKSKCLEKALDKAYTSVFDKTIKLYGPVK